MDAQRARVLQTLLDGTAWVDRTRRFARNLRLSGHGAGGLLLVGTPQEEPWHLTAHLDDEARWNGLPELAPTLVRLQPPPNAPAHLAVDLRRLEATRKGETLLVVAPGDVPENLLERFDDARRKGATLLALESGDRELRSLAHESLTVLDTAESGAGDAGGDPIWDTHTLRPDGLIVPQAAGLAFETAQHLVSVAAGERTVAVGSRRGFRDRLGRLLDRVAG